MDRFVAWGPSSRQLLFAVGVALALSLIAVAALRSGVDFSGSTGRSPEPLPARGASVVSVEFPGVSGFENGSFATLSGPEVAADTAAPGSGTGSTTDDGSDGGSDDGSGGGTADDGLTGVEPVDDAVDDTVELLPIDPSTTVATVDETLDETVEDPTGLIGG